ncbi:MAG: 3-keto-disaccharide hydrolase [Coraliomargaritaceae bacterium]
MKYLLLVSLTFLYTSCSHTTKDRSAEGHQGFTSIFDGQTLNGWKIIEKPESHNYHATEENFFVKDGAIHCYQLPNKKGGLLISETTYADFELEMEIHSDWGCDSGIFLRCTEDGHGIQVLNDYLPSGCVGFLYGQGTGGFISRPIRLYQHPDANNNSKGYAKDLYDGVAIDGLLYSIDAEGWNKLWLPDTWNTIRIRCEGLEPVVTTWINGVKVMTMDGTTYKARHLRDENAQKWSAAPAWNRERVEQVTGGRGSIAVQVHPGTRWKPGGSAKYRNIRIREL